MSANLENSSVAMGLEKFSFHTNPKEGQCQRMFKLLYNCTHFICQQGYTQNPSSQVQAVCEPRISRCTSWASKRQRNQRSNCQHVLDHQTRKRVPENHLFLFIDYAKSFDFVDHNKLWKILKEMEIPDHLSCLLTNLYMGQAVNSRNWT